MKKTVFLFTFLTGMGITGLHGQIIKKTGCFSLTVEPALTFASEKITENIYYSAPNEDKKISMLEWENRMLMYGIKLNSTYKNFWLNLNFFTSCKFLQTGQMEDSDWRNTSDYSMKTNYSVGKINTGGNYEAGFETGLIFQPNKLVEISPFLGIKYSFDSFSRQNATGWYGDSNFTSDGNDHWWYSPEAQKFPYTIWSEEKEKYVTGRILPIDYIKHDFYSWLGILIRSSPSKKCNILFEIAVSPFSYYLTIDTHHAKKTDGYYEKHFKGIQYNFFNKIKNQVNVEFNFSKQFFLCIGIKKEYKIYENKGKLYLDHFLTTPQEQYYASSQKIEISNFEYNIEISLKIRIK